MVNFQNGTVLTDGSYGILEIPSRKQRFRYALSVDSSARIKIFLERRDVG